MLPELTFGEHVTLPSFYGKNCVTGLGMRNSFYFRYEQPDLINQGGDRQDIGSVKVQWTFAGKNVSCEFAYTVKQQITLDKFRYVLVVAAPHSKYRVQGSPVLGPLGLRCSVVKDDFQGTWQETEVVSRRPHLPHELRQDPLPAVPGPGPPPHHEARPRLPPGRQLRAGRRRGKAPMLSRRIIPCLDVTAGRVVKGVRFKELRDAGDPVECAAAYDAQGADELVFLDITASSDGRRIMHDVVAATAERCFMPLTVGGGLRSTSDIEAMLKSGADKVSLNTSAIADPGLILESADRFGSQCIVLAIDAKLEPGPEPALAGLYARRTQPHGP